MIRLMIGRDLKSLYIPPKAAPGEPGCEIADVAHHRLPRPGGRRSTVRRGEILGLAGLVGSGRTALARAIFGIDPLLGGDGPRSTAKPLAIGSPRDAIAHGIYLVPEDRKRSGLILDMPIRENITLAELWPLRPLVADRARRARTAAAEQQRQRLGIKTPSVETRGGDAVRRQPAEGGARPSGCRCGRSVIIFDEPTRGIDVGAKSEIYRLMRELADARRRDPDDLQRHGGGDRRERPHRRDARGPASAASSSARSSPSTTCSSSPSATAGRLSRGPHDA